MDVYMSVSRLRAVFFRSAGLLVAASGLSIGDLPAADAQTTAWDSTISNSNWYVPVPQLLAYASPRSGFTQPLPVGDQTLWSLGSSVNGVFSGVSQAQLAIGPILTYSVSTMQGTVSPSGQLAIVFTPSTGGPATLGVGQMQSRAGVTEMEMQMITGNQLLVTHWAYMVPYNPATFTPPAAQAIPLSLSANNYQWLEGTPWKIVSPALFGTSAAGKFIVTNYKNGYFWGQGIGPSGSNVGSYTLMASTTPEGKVLFNTLNNGALSSLYGNITGDPLSAQMLLGTYGVAVESVAVAATLNLVAPYAKSVIASQNPSAINAANTLYGIAGTTNGLYGPMSPVIDVLNNLTGPMLSNAVGQTLPVLVGAASQATYNTQRAFQTTVLTRLDNIRGMNSGNYFDTDGHAWAKPFGSLTSQGGLNDVAGYRASGGGLAAGVDKSFSPEFALGGVFAYSYNAITGSADVTTNSLNINSYQLGLYGAYALDTATDLNVQFDVGLNQNRENRSIGFMQSNANANYDSYTTHLGLGIKHVVPVASAVRLIPSIRIDYASINAQSYEESGAGVLNLNVNSQTYQELMLSMGMRADYQLTDYVKLTANADLGYNTLNNQTQITASYVGGGNSFVTYGLNVSPWLYSAGVGLVAFEKDAMEVGVRYDLQASPTGFLNQIASIRFMMKF